MGERTRAWAAVAAVVGVVGVVPLVTDRDSFPLSTFPMFASRRSSAEQVTTAVAVADDGRVVRLSPERIAGTDEVIQAAATVRTAVQQGRADDLCAEIATRLAGADADSGVVVAVEVVTERYDAPDWFAGRRDPLERVVHARCPVEVPGRRAGSGGAP